MPELGPFYKLPEEVRRMFGVPVACHEDAGRFRHETT
jgi:hypothetical protein